MSARVHTPLFAAAVLALIAVATAPTQIAAAPARTDPEPAQTQDLSKGSGFALPSHVIASGGGSSSGGVFAIRGTLGQLDADPLHPASGGVFKISGGFWPGAAASTPGEALFANGFEG